METIALFLKEHFGILAAAVALLNLFSAILFGIDKRKAKRKLWRIPETALLWSAVPFSALGALMGMRIFRHKTRHKKFAIGVPLLLILQLGALAALAISASRSLG